MCATGVKGVAASYPFVPGIDAVGTVAKSNSDVFNEGDQVICSGYKLGMSVNGGFGSMICVPADWVVHLPNAMSELEAMSYGVAGLTSAACVNLFWIKASLILYQLQYQERLGSWLSCSRNFK